MRVLTTGANGHLGANVVRGLLKRGYEVVPFVRRGADLRRLEGLGLEYVYGDVMEESSLKAAAEGCDAMIHMAAVYRYWKSDPDEIMQPALVGTWNAFAAAKAAGIQRMVYTSTTWTIGVTDHPDKVFSSTHWNESARNPYTVAKVQAEREAWRLAEETGIEMIVICPGGIIGPYDYRMTPSTELLLGLINGTTPVYKGGMSLVDVRDVADVHVGAVEGGKVGERYIAAGENSLITRYGEIITKLTGEKPMRLPGGRSAVQMVAVLAEFQSRITRAEPMITRTLASEIGDRYMFYDTSNTTRDFGIQFKDAEAVVREGTRWLLHIGQIKPGLAARIKDKFPPDPSWVV